MFLVRHTHVVVHPKVLVALAQTAQSRPSLHVVQRVVAIKAMVRHVLPMLVITVDVKRVIPQIVLAHALKILSTQIGLQMATVTTVHMYLQIMATADQQVFQSG